MNNDSRYQIQVSRRDPVSECKVDDAPDTVLAMDEKGRGADIALPYGANNEASCLIEDK